MKQNDIFYILPYTESTNNYAMGRIHAQKAVDGEAWFSSNQLMGKGQRGKHWITEPGKNMALSIVIKPSPHLITGPFYLSAIIALVCREFLSCYEERVKIKWPNDVYWGDRKAGGILVENIFVGKIWHWAVAGIGLNINQEAFDPSLSNPVSLKQITGRKHDPEEVAREIHNMILSALQKTEASSMESTLQEYNRYLYKKGESIRLKKGNAVFETTIRSVNNQCQLLTEDVMERAFEVGEVEWLL